MANTGQIVNNWKNQKKSWVIIHITILMSNKSKKKSFTFLGAIIWAFLVGVKEKRYCPSFVLMLTVSSTIVELVVVVCFNLQTFLYYERLSWASHSLLWKVLLLYTPKIVLRRPLLRWEGLSAFFLYSGAKNFF